MYKVLLWFTAITVTAGFYSPRVEATGAETITTHSVTAPQALSAPLLLFPVADSALSTRKVRCTWTRVSGADRYRVQMSSDTLFSSTIRDTTLSDTSRYFWMPGYGQYYWRVSAESQTDMSEWSELRKMNVPSSVPPVKLLGPACGSVSALLPVELSWSAAGGAYQYFIVVARDSLLKNVVVDTALMSWYTKCSMPELAPNSRYYWCVYSRGVEYGGEPSDTCGFVTTTTSGFNSFAEPGIPSCAIIANTIRARIPTIEGSSEYSLVDICGIQLQHGIADIRNSVCAIVLEQIPAAGIYFLCMENKYRKQRTVLYVCVR